MREKSKTIIEYIKSKIPSKQEVMAYKTMQLFGSFMLKKQLWQFNAKSVPIAFAIGVFVAWLPMPMQMLLSAILAVLFDANIPIAIACAWLSNPFTMAPLFFLAYTTGTYCLGLKPKKIKFHADIDWLKNTLIDIWKPFLLGSLICAAISALVAYILAKMLLRKRN